MRKTVTPGCLSPKGDWHPLTSRACPRRGTGACKISWRLPVRVPVPAGTGTH
ncbi:hypothetical protein L531_4290 [Bordetella bronchiseptica MO275]|nr:hypothetical protein L531_4290 [Bordetella bronchiseptica MO275]